ncbi:hypothetical protein ACFVFS_22570 [Kitasatospora sp. NPDC057692]|uniref:hypothetical protein n=1 Tax=Kitasatospora sp. NPDC057692 TaxID=3346215 RepID=UPI0036CA3B52
MKPAEVLAARIVEAVFLADGEAVVVEPWDEKGRQGAHDFWVLRGEVREALEVTTLADEAAKRDSGHWDKRGPKNGATIPGLASCWALMIDSTEKADPLRKRLAEWLLALEADGITRTGRWDGVRFDDEPHPVVHALAVAGVLVAEVIPGGPAGWVQMGYSSDALGRPAGDPDHVARTLRAALDLPREQAHADKLARSGAPGRHLFFHLDTGSRYDVARAMTEGTPSLPLQADERITSVWLSVIIESGADVLRWSAGHGWRRTTVALGREPQPD